ncbi:hypothetical protein VZT92_003897 [Zoarces viviparus]|uniref:Uncharacterized protein n=1 Tax=Zoarces viviparus TaxID=48416 RepID=A0AAW1FV70_ZOAVI
MRPWFGAVEGNRAGQALAMGGALTQREIKAAMLQGPPGAQRAIVIITPPRPCSEAGGRRSLWGSDGVLRGNRAGSVLP